MYFMTKNKKNKIDVYIFKQLQTPGKIKILQEFKDHREKKIKAHFTKNC